MRFLQHAAKKNERWTGLLCRVPNGRHTANKTAPTIPNGSRMFAVCPTSGTRQRRKRCRVLRFAVFFFTSPRSMKDFYRASDLYRVYFYGAHGECPLCGVLYIFRVLQFGHTAKALFTVCPRYSTRQRLRHTANTHSPVVSTSLKYRKKIVQAHTKRCCKTQAASNQL